MYYYVDRDTLVYAKGSHSKLNLETLLEVPFPPKTGLSRWDTEAELYVPLTEIEVGETLEDESTTTVITKRGFNFFVCYNSSAIKEGWIKRQNGTTTWSRPYTIKCDAVLNEVTFDCDKAAWQMYIYRNRKHYKTLHKTDNNPGLILENLQIPFTKGDLFSSYAKVYDNKDRIKFPGAGFYFDCL